MKKAIFGFGGHAREVIVQMNEELTIFVDEPYTNEYCKSINDFDPKLYEIIIGVSDTNLRKKIVNKLPKETKYFTFIHPTAQIMDKNIIVGNGSFIGANSILTTNIKIGDHAILNRSNHIGHDTIIGDFFSAMPNSVVSGNVMIGNNVYLGTNASIREKINICNNVTIGLNSGVVKDIIDSGVYVGVPAKKIK